MSKVFDRYAGAAFLLAGIAFMAESRRISESAYGSKVGPDLFPFGLGALLVLLSLRLLYETFKYTERETKKQDLDYKRFLIILVSAILYACLLETFGYVISTFLFLMVAFQTMEKGGWLKTILISGGFSYGIYYLFSELLQGSLPGFPTWF